MNASVGLDGWMAGWLDGWSVAVSIDTGRLKGASDQKNIRPCKKVSNCQLPIANCQMSNVKCQMPIANCQLPIANCQLPNSTSVWPYREVSPWGYVQGIFQADRIWSVRASIMANQTFGGRLDGLSVDYALSPMAGVRAGVVDYKMSWCRDYDVDSPWAYDINDFCMDKTNKQLPAGAPGVQAYLNIPTDGLQLQAIGGLYYPKVFSYDDFESSRSGTLTQSRLGIAHATDSNYKRGLALNAIHPRSGVEFRLGWLGSELALSYEPEKYGPLFYSVFKSNDGNIFNRGMSDRRQSDAYYFAGKVPLGIAWRLEGSYTDMAVDRVTTLADDGSTTTDRTTHQYITLGLSCLASGKDTVSAGASALRSIKTSPDFETSRIEPKGKDFGVITDYDKKFFQFRGCGGGAET